MWRQVMTTIVMLMTIAIPARDGHAARSWQAQNVPHMSQILRGLNCPAPAGCRALSRSDVTAGADGGHTLLTISCPGVTVCYAGGTNGTILATRDGGATWQSQSWQSEYVTAVSPIAAITCPSVDGCFAYANTPCEALGARQPLVHTANGGSSWSTAYIPGCGSALACPAATTCYTLVSPTGPGLPAFMRTTDSGRTWQVQARINSARSQESLACPAPTVCYAAFGGAIARSTDGGKGWAISRMNVRPCPPLGRCPLLEAITCPNATTCDAGGTLYQNNEFIASVVTTKDAFRTHTSHLIQGLHGITALSCPTPSVCFALGGLSVPQTSGWVSADDAGRFAVTTDAGKSWHVGRISNPYPLDALACPSAGVCYAAGFLGRLMGTRDGGATWHDLIHAIFLSGSYGDRQPPHSYTPWFTAARPWQVMVGTAPGMLGTGGRPVAAGCKATSTVVVYVRNAQNQIVAGPIRTPRRLEMGGFVRSTTIQFTGKLRLDVASSCSSFSVRVDGVQQAQG